MNRKNLTENRWDRLLSSLRGTGFYQIFFVRALQRRTSIVWYWTSAILALLAGAWGIHAMNPVLALEQMSVATGRVERVSQAARTSCGDKLYLRLPDDRVKKYHLCVDEEEGQAILGQEVTVWSQREISIYGMVDYIGQIKKGNQLIKDYQPIKANREWLRDHVDSWVIGTFITLALLPLFRVWWINRKPALDDSIKPDNQQGE